MIGRFLASLLLLFALAAAAPADPIRFWDTPRHGGNSFNRLPPDTAYFEALAGHGATWVRIAHDKWKGEGRDFLIGDADAYRGLPPNDLATLKAVLDRADAAGLKVVIAPLSLPGMRWRQNNDGAVDDRLWRDKAWWDQTAAFWRDLATELKGHPAVAAYNIVNEPVPELRAGITEHASGDAQRVWYDGVRGTARDLPAFYTRVIAAIRAVDPQTPIMVDAGWYAAADAFAYWPEPLADDRLLYAFHMYEPYEVTSGPNLKRDMPLPYPGPAAFGGEQVHWDKDRVAAYLARPAEWARAHNVPANRLVAAEFGCMRRLPFCPAYLEDVLTALDAQGLHWAFYAFREDAWDGMDYELGSGPVNWRYWDAMEAGLPDPVERLPDTPQFEPIARRLRASSGS